MRKSVKTKYELKEYKIERQLSAGSWIKAWQGFGINPLAVLNQYLTRNYEPTSWIFTIESEVLADRFIIFKHPFGNSGKWDFTFSYEEIN